MLNLKVRLKNKNFWLTFIPALLLFFKVIAEVFGYDLEIDGLTNQAEAVIQSLFGLLAILGIVNDPTTAGFLIDSKQAQKYDEPKEG